MATTYAYIINANGTLSEWSSSETILKKGELGILVDDNNYILKIGDGVTRFNDLPLFSPGMITKNGINKTGEIFNSYTGDNKNIASGSYSHAEGYKSNALGDNSHAEGSSTASGDNSHAEGYGSKAEGDYSHAEGTSKASAICSHAEGDSTTFGDYSHAEGNTTTAVGNNSHAEGKLTRSNGENSHASGFGTRAYNDNMTAIGSYNIDGTNDDGIIFAIGNGTDDNNRSNAFTVDNAGYAKSNANFSDNANITDNTLVTKEYVDAVAASGGSFSMLNNDINLNNFSLLNPSATSDSGSSITGIYEITGIPSGNNKTALHIGTEYDITDLYISGSLFGSNSADDNFVINNLSQVTIKSNSLTIGNTQSDDVCYFNCKINLNKDIISDIKLDNTHSIKTNNISSTGSAYSVNMNSDVIVSNEKSLSVNNIKPTTDSINVNGDINIDGDLKLDSVSALNSNEIAVNTDVNLGSGNTLKVNNISSSIDNEIAIHNNIRIDDEKKIIIDNNTEYAGKTVELTFTFEDDSTETYDFLIGTKIS